LLVHFHGLAAERGPPQEKCLGAKLLGVVVEKIKKSNMNNTENTQKTILTKILQKIGEKSVKKIAHDSPKPHYRIFAQIQSTDFWFLFYRLILQQWWGVGVGVIKLGRGKSSCTVK
jgi:hypothetical protein